MFTFRIRAIWTEKESNMKLFQIVPPENYVAFGCVAGQSTDVKDYPQVRFGCKLGQN